MISPAEFALFGALFFVVVVSAVILGLLCWRAFVNPNFLGRGLPERINHQETRIAHLEKRVADQEAELEVLRRQVDELSERVSNLFRWETQ